MVQLKLRHLYMTHLDRNEKNLKTAMYRIV